MTESDTHNSEGQAQPQATPTDEQPPSLPEGEGGSAPSGSEQSPAVEEQKPEGEASEEKKDEEEEPTPAVDKYASKFAALARKERRVFEARRELKALEAELVPLREARALLSKDPIAALEKMGINVQDTYTKLTRKYLDKDDGVSSDDVSALQAKINALEQSLHQRERNTQLNEFKGHIRAYLAEEADKYAYCAAKDAGDLILEVMQTAQENEGRMLTLGEAADMVEKHFEEEAAAYERVRAKKLGSKPQEEAPLGATKQSNGHAASQKSKTLSNSHAQTAPPAADTDGGPLDVHERARWLVETGRARFP